MAVKGSKLIIISWGREGMRVVEEWKKDKTKTCKVEREYGTDWYILKNIMYSGMR